MSSWTGSDDWRGIDGNFVRLLHFPVKLEWVPILQWYMSVTVPTIHVDT